MESNKTNFQWSISGSEKSQSDIKPDMQSSQLMKLLEDELKDIYWVENALILAMPKMIKNTTSEELEEELTAHLEETRDHVIRLEKVFSLIDVKAEAKKCEAMEGLINEASDIMDSFEAGSKRDAGIISAVQKVEHYEIASYGTLRQFAETLDLIEVEELLAASLQEEKEADMRLSDIAMEDINEEAAKETA